LYCDTTTTTTTTVNIDKRIITRTTAAADRNDVKQTSLRNRQS